MRQSADMGIDASTAVILHKVAVLGLTAQTMRLHTTDTVLKEFKTRLGRIGLEYQSPIAA